MKFTIPLVPKAQMRARHGRTKSGFSVTYKADGQRRQEDMLCAMLQAHRPESPLGGPLSLKVTAYLPIPMSWSGKRIVEAEKGKIHPDCKPDIDNLVKNLCDCLTAMSFWHDDKQIVFLTAGKLYNDGRGPRWEVEITSVPPDGGGKSISQKPKTQTTIAARPEANGVEF